jgi:hypothetical protein
LNKKIKDLINEGFKIRFKNTKVIDKKRMDGIIKELDEPINKIVMSMFKLNSL